MNKTLKTSLVLLLTVFALAACGQVVKQVAGVHTAEQIKTIVAELS